jgi:hypothetical protein
MKALTSITINTSVSKAFLSTKADTSTIIIAVRKITDVHLRFTSNIDFACLSNPIRNPDPANANIFPNVYVSANRAGLPAITPTIEPQDSMSIRKDRPMQKQKAKKRSLKLIAGRQPGSSGSRDSWSNLKKPDIRISFKGETRHLKCDYIGDLRAIR